MKKKCSRYEALFTFADEAVFKEHLATCEDCRAEQELMDKVSALLKEVKPAKHVLVSRPAPWLKAACFLAVVLGLTFGLHGSEPLSAEELGFPVDSYGFIMVDDE